MLKAHRGNFQRQLTRLFAECNFKTASDLAVEPLERWLVARTREGMSARTRNSYLVAIRAFCNWGKKRNVGRLKGNPFDELEQLCVDADRRHTRRAMTEAELTRLLAIASARPLQEAQRLTRGKRKGMALAKLSDATVAKLKALGQERALIYKTLVLTGIRSGELRSLNVGRVILDGTMPRIELNAADEKNGEGNHLPIHPDLADDLTAWIADTGKAADSLLFDLPAAPSKILNRDLKAAGIAKKDSRGRVLDMHALRTTFGTMLSTTGAGPRTAQAAMRHSDISLTMGIYTDPKMLDVKEAISKLPSLPLPRKATEEE